MKRSASAASTVSKTSDGKLDANGNLAHLPSLPPCYECPHPHPENLDDVEAASADSSDDTGAHLKHQYDRAHLPWIQVRLGGGGRS